MLLSDGENNENPDPIGAAQSAADRGIRIDTVAIGSPAGVDLGWPGVLHPNIVFISSGTLTRGPPRLFPPAAEARYLILLFAETSEARNPRRKELIAKVLDDLARLSD